MLKKVQIFALILFLFLCGSMEGKDIEDLIVDVRVWDCEDTNEIGYPITEARLQNLENKADHYDWTKQQECDSLNREILKQHQGHEISLSNSQHAIYCNPGHLCPVCWHCSKCEHFDLYTYIPLERIEVHCSGHIWRIAK